MPVSPLGFSPATFGWFEGLEAHNDVDWFAEHRDAFREHVEEPFTRLLEDVSVALADAAVPLSGGARTTFRMNRDVRFSADKSPYHPYRAGLLTPSGTKAEAGGLVYVQLNAAGGFLAGGLYRPGSAQLEANRQAILALPERFATIVAGLKAAGYDLDRAEAVKTMPRGYAGFADHPQADVLRLKQYVVLRPLTTESWLDGTIRDDLVDFAVRVGPLIAWAGEVTEGRD
jgi:uncharacterized protein (TIGR02453 family)